MVKEKHDVDVLEKCPTGIRGLDEITKGGLPRGRSTLICGSAGSGKPLFAMEYLMRGAMDYGEPGAIMTFEETPENLAKNFITLGFDLSDMVSRDLIATDHVYIEPKSRRPQAWSCYMARPKALPKRTWSPNSSKT